MTMQANKCIVECIVDSIHSLISNSIIWKSVCECNNSRNMGRMCFIYYKLIKVFEVPQQFFFHLAKKLITLIKSI